MVKVEGEKPTYKEEWFGDKFRKEWEEVTGVTNGTIKRTKKIIDRWKIEVEEYYWLQNGGVR